MIGGTVESIFVNVGDKVSRGRLLATISSPESDSLCAFNQMRVSTGFSEDGFVQIILKDSIPPDARVVISGIYFVKSEELKQGK